MHVKQRGLMMASDDALLAGDIRAEVRTWIDDHWNPQQPLGEWWHILAQSGWGFPDFPERWFGRGLPGESRRIVRQELQRAGAFGPPHGIATMMVAPLLVEMGSDEQREKWLPGIVDGSEIWCQLFSEPDAGSDLAGARTTAVRDGDLWRVNGQKVWTSGGHYAKWAILVARTDPAAPKHSGLSFFGIDMRQDGIQPKPLVQMNGLAEFNEVFLDDATTAHFHLIGEEGKGWPVALRTLSYERESLDADAEPGIQTDLDLSIAAGRYASGEIADGSEGFMPGGLEAWELLCSVIAANGQQTDPRIRDRAVKIYTGIKTSSWMSQRFAQAPEVGAEVSLGKLAATQLMRDWRDLALTALGPNGQLLDGEGTFDGVPAQIALSVPGLSIAGGTDEIQRNIVGERVLGLPREPRPSNE